MIRRLAIFLLLLAPIQGVLACGCGQGYGLDRKLAESGTVFLARVDQVSPDQANARLTVMHAIKGSLNDGTTLSVTTAQETSCAIHPLAGDELLVFHAERDTPPRYITFCSAWQLRAIFDHDQDSDDARRLREFLQKTRAPKSADNLDKPERASHSQ